MTQPPLSRQIAALEAEVGTLLFQRNPRNVTLTTAGEQFLKDARQIVHDAEAAARNAQLAAGGSLGQLSFGFMMHAAHTTVPPLLGAFTSSFPKVDLRLREMVPNAILDQVLAGGLDAGLVFEAEKVAGLATARIFRDTLCVVLPVDHPMAVNATVDIADLREQEMIGTSNESSPCLRGMITKLCNASGFTPRIRLEVHMQQTIVSLVAEGLGIAIVPSSLRKYPHERVMFRHFVNSPVLEQALIWRHENDNPALAHFVDVARNLALPHLLPEPEQVHKQEEVCL